MNLKYHFKYGDGFTVMEMLVVLVLLGLVTTLLMQGFFYVLNLRVRFLTQLEKQRTTTLQSHWFRSVCNSLTPGHPEGDYVFSGTDRQFQGLSLSPLRGNCGAPTLIRLELAYEEGNLLLHYTENQGEPLELGRWLGDKGDFYYLDRQGQWQSQWPPPQAQVSQLPKGVLLAVEGPRGPEAWFAFLPGRHNHKPDIQEFLRNFR